jgi:hypothetical protein
MSQSVEHYAGGTEEQRANDFSFQHFHTKEGWMEAIICDF